MQKEANLELVTDKKRENCSKRATVPQSVKKTTSFQPFLFNFSLRHSQLSLIAYMAMKSLSPFLPLQITVKSRTTSETGAKYNWAQPNFSKFPRSPSRTKYSSTSRLSLSTANAGIMMNRHGTIGDKDGLIIVDHGSRRKESNLMLNEFVNMFRDKTKYPIVEPAHMELAEPSIKDAFGLCVQQGANRVIVSPFFLFPGRHWHQDIPSLTAEAAKEHPGVSYIVTAPLGLHELLVDVVNDRIKHCLSHVAGDAEECAACVGTGKCKLY